MSYVVVSLALGGWAGAKSVFWWLAGLCCALVFAGFLRSPGRNPAAARTQRANLIRICGLLELIAFNVALTLVLAELSLRAYADWRGVSTLVSHTMDAYRLLPGRDYGGGLRGNRLGYPGREFQIDKQPGRLRLAALGDSFAVGPAVPYADNYLNLLEKDLPGVEIYNFGVSGIGPREYLALLRRDVWTYRPDFVLVSLFVGNDITEEMATPRHLDPRQCYAYLLITRAWRLACEHWRQSAAAPDVTAAGLGEPPLSEATFREIEARRLEVCRKSSSTALEKKWRRTLADLDEIISECRARKVPLGMVLIPDEFQVNPAVLVDTLRMLKMEHDEVDLTLPQRRLVGFCAEREVPCLDLMPIYEGVTDTYAPRDTHWNARGNHLAARHISRWLKQTTTALK
jgi:hypothetical protein